ncbi:MAG TPA: LysM peptidoglycan-binding domain-containing protein [Opitutus sp.]|nr:LysM peptidoglycan-binding domain-containing protein [Opitutus sp.]
MIIRQIVAVLLTSVALMIAAGCERADDRALLSEADEPNFRQGQQLVKQGRSQEALSAYLKVIAKRGESAPESHLEAGLLYLDQVKDPLAAIYHFRKYLELQPNSRQAVYVKGQIDVAKREFARTLPAQPMENQSERLNMFDQVDRLQRENDQMRAELAALRGGVSTPATRSRSTVNTLPPVTYPRVEAPGFDEARSPVQDSPISLAPEAPLESPPQSPSQSTVASQPVRALPTKPTAPSTGMRRHVVVKGDTLFSLAQKYYGNRSRWRDIYAANRDLLPDENSLRLGMEIRLP